MNFSITSGEQSLQVFTATLILSPFCSVQDSLRFKSIWLKLKKTNWVFQGHISCKRDESAYDTAVDSFVDLSKEALAEDPPQSNVTPLNPILDRCNKSIFEPVKVSWCKRGEFVIDHLVTDSTHIQIYKPDFGLSSRISQ